MSRYTLLNGLCPISAVPRCADTTDCGGCNSIVATMLDEYEAEIKADMIDHFKKLIREHKNYFVSNGIAELFIDVELKLMEEPLKGEERNNVETCDIV